MSGIFENRRFLPRAERTLGDYELAALYQEIDVRGGRGVFNFSADGVLVWDAGYGEPQDSSTDWDGTSNNVIAP